MTAATLLTQSPRPVVTVPPCDRAEVSFIFVTFGTSPIVIAGIRSLVSSLTATSVAYEVIVVDNRHPTRPNRTINHLLLDTSGVRVVESTTNRGFGGGCNLGVSRSEGERLAFVNPDIEFAPGWFEPLATAVQAGAAIAAPLLHNPDGSLQSAGHRLFGDGSTAPVAGDDMRADYASAACWLMTRGTFDAVGGFDEAFYPAYYEDVDFALSARRFGGTVVERSSAVVHARGSSTTALHEPDTTSQRLRLVDKWPELATDFPPRPA